MTSSSIKTMKHAGSGPETARIFDQLVRSRRSTRGFLPEPVKPEILGQIFATATYAPSNCNTQPWYCHEVSGAMRDRLSAIFMDTIGQGNYSLDFPYDARYEGIFRQRQLVFDYQNSLAHDLTYHGDPHTGHDAMIIGLREL